MADFKNYDPAKVILIYQGHIITGFAAGTFITAERDTDSFTDEVGADGVVTRVMSHDKRGTITVTLEAVAASNAILGAAVVADELLGVNFGNVKCTDLNSTTTLSSTDAWVMKPANYGAADTTSQREWKIRCASLYMLIGASLV